VVEAGQITAVGSHEELLHTSPMYQRLYQLQFADEAEASTEAAMAAGVKA
jgi:subfamily B ATP-binding cassette protein MsbA